MIIKRARVYGMCFGVRDAIALAGQVAAQSGPVTVLGQLVHNPDVLQSLREQGVDVAENINTVRVEPGTHYVITAHGISDAQREVWSQTGATLHDTTCPLVQKAHHRLREFVAMGLHPVVIGKAGHVEVLGLTGDYREATVIETESDIAKLPPERGLGVVSQTTQPIERVRDLVLCIRLLRPTQALFFADTVCQPTKDRQNALRELCAEVEAVIVVGGRESNNTRQLVLAAQSYGVRAYSVEGPHDLHAEWLINVARVGLTAGTSTPDAVIDAVEQALMQLSAHTRLAA
ncbi:MAG: 4-hydroxy-3-methylbut-2-enyl diphosphate reductase [Verrucomicrobia bacterium Tous-C9LFEB]|nr:MAG: 4-hydroxy-3-methylbut-2-enyl diphosphate reductase [Verrucomicrobia bacterium Tous-C9LFEB]